MKETRIERQLSEEQVKQLELFLHELGFSEEGELIYLEYPYDKDYWDEEEEEDRILHVKWRKE